MDTNLYLQERREGIKYNLNDNYASAFICIDKKEVKKNGAIIKWTKQR